MTIAAIFTLVLVLLLAAALWYSVIFPRQPFRSPLPPPTPEEARLAGHLRQHVEGVASRPHNIAYYRNLEASARYIEQTLRGFGLTPVAQHYEVAGRDVRNIEVVFEPLSLSTPPGCYVVGAHYDSPDDSPGANDNGSGVAGALEIARRFAAQPPGKKRVRLAFFVNEEQPYGMTQDMGSWRYVRSLVEGGETVLGGIVLETLGYFSDTPGSQTYPAPLGLIYPHKGNFVAFVGLPGSRRLVGRVVHAFRQSVAFPSIGGVAPAFIAGVDLSDHWSFHQFGLPAVMVTDTAPYRNPRYHRINDLPDTVDYASLARITLGLECVVRKIAD